MMPRSVLFMKSRQLGTKDWFLQLNNVVVISLRIESVEGAMPKKSLMSLSGLEKSSSSVPFAIKRI